MKDIDKVKLLGLFLGIAIIMGIPSIISAFTIDSLDDNDLHFDRMENYMMPIRAFDYNDLVDDEPDDYKIVISIPSNNLTEDQFKELSDLWMDCISSNDWFIDSQPEISFSLSEAQDD